MEKVLTISVAAYNVEKFINNTLMPFAYAKFSDDLEVLVIDDGGNDKTLSIAKSYEARFPSIFKTIHKENGGWGSAVNYGVQHAQGKYFKQLDGDDTFLEENLSEFIELLRTTDADLVYSPYVLYNEIKGQVVSTQGLSIDIPVKEMILFKDYADKLDIVMHSCTFKIELLRNQNIKLLEHCFYTDIEYVLKACSGVQSITYFDKPIYWYRVALAGQSMSYQGVKKHYKDHLRVTFELLNEFDSCDFPTNIQQYYQGKLQYLVNNQYSIFTILTPTTRHKKELVNFDDEIKNNYPDKYNCVGNYIKICRLVNFQGYSLVVGLRYTVHFVKKCIRKIIGN